MTPLKPKLVVASPFYAKCSMCKWELIVHRRGKRSIAQLTREQANEFARHLPVHHKHDTDSST